MDRFHALILKKKKKKTKDFSYRSKIKCFKVQKPVKLKTVYRIRLRELIPISVYKV